MGGFVGIGVAFARSFVTDVAHQQEEEDKLEEIKQSLLPAFLRDHKETR
jgi:hypothetical protein